MGYLGSGCSHPIVEVHRVQKVPRPVSLVYKAVSMWLSIHLGDLKLSLYAFNLLSPGRLSALSLEWLHPICLESSLLLPTPYPHPASKPPLTFPNTSSLTSPMKPLLAPELFSLCPHLTHSRHSPYHAWVHLFTCPSPLKFHEDRK